MNRKSCSKGVKIVTVSIPIELLGIQPFKIVYDGPDTCTTTISYGQCSKRADLPKRILKISKF